MQTLLVSFIVSCFLLSNEALSKDMSNLYKERELLDWQFILPSTFRNALT